MTQPKLLGAAEVCRLLGIQRMTLKRLRDAKAFPKPRAELAAGPVWTWSQIERAGYIFVEQDDPSEEEER